MWDVAAELVLKDYSITKNEGYPVFRLLPDFKLVSKTPLKNDC